ncbi:hypothetical protein PIB30_106564, partial [Stylosanthes scabra]|nr:hypothetical protein [Stylosanthes scabra]
MTGMRMKIEKNNLKRFSHVICLWSTLTLDNLDQLVRDYRLNTHSKELPCNRAFKVKKNPKRSKKKLIGEDRIEVKKRSSLRILGDRRPFEEGLKQGRGRKAQVSHIIRQPSTYNVGNLAKEAD